MWTFLIPVTQKHIDQGIIGHWALCPVALAVCDVFRIEPTSKADAVDAVITESNYTIVRHNPEEYNSYYALRLIHDVLTALDIMAFDRDGNMEPFVAEMVVDTREG